MWETKQQSPIEKLCPAEPFHAGLSPQRVSAVLHRTSSKGEFSFLLGLWLLG